VLNTPHRRFTQSALGFTGRCSTFCASRPARSRPPARNARQLLERRY